MNGKRECSNPDEEASAFASACELQRRAATVGFDWPDAAGPRAKIREELAELDEASDAAARGEELGDLLFAVVNLARHLDVEPEAALAAANRKFQHRFRYIEQRLSAEGLCPNNVDLARLDDLWNEAKLHERRRNNR